LANVVSAAYKERSILVSCRRGAAQH